MFSFKYSVRPNTLASKRMVDDVEETEKTRRIVALQTLQRDIQTRLHEEAVGTVVDVLVDTVSRRREGELSGRTFGNTVVSFPATTDTSQHGASHSEALNWIGHRVPVRIIGAGPHSLRGVADIPRPLTGTVPA